MILNSHSALGPSKKAPISKSYWGGEKIRFPFMQLVMLRGLQTSLSCIWPVVVKELVCNYKGVNFSIACTFSFYQIGMNISHSSVCCNWNKLQHLLLKTELFVAMACPLHLKFPSHTSASQDAFEGRFMCLSTIQAYCRHSRRL